MGTRICRPIVIILAGGSGQEVGARIVRMVPNPISLIIVAYDTELDNRYQNELKNYFVKADINRASYTKEHPIGYPHIWNRLNVEMIPEVNSIVGGAAQQIELGSLIFVASIKRIIKSIRAALRSLASANLSNQAKSKGVNLVDDRIYCILVRSICGGMGSGTSIYLPYLVKKELSSNIIRDEMRFVLLDFIIAPDAFIPKVRDPIKAKASAHIFLHMMTEYYGKDSNDEFIFGEDPDLHIPAGKPASHITYYIGDRNLSSGRGRTILTLDECYDIIAKIIVALYQEPFFSSYWMQVKEFYSDSIKIISGQPAFLTGFGYTELLFDRDAIREWVKLNTTKRVLKMILGG